MATDARLSFLLDEACSFIDRVTGWFFEPRSLVLTFDGRDTPTIEPPVPPIRLDTLAIDGAAISTKPADLDLVGAPVLQKVATPRLTLRHGRFPKGTANVSAAGLWGYTEPDGSAAGRTPPPIRVATLQLVLRALPLLGDQEAWTDARLRGRILEERTRDQSYRLSPPPFLSFMTGDPEIDILLLGYRRPAGLGAT
jgi:hypothetical protein